MRVSATAWQRVDTVLRTAECIAALSMPPEAAPGRAWFAIGGARRVVTVVSVGPAGDARLEAFAPLPSGPTGPAGRAADARDSVVAAISAGGWGGWIAVARGCGAGVMRLSVGEAGAKLEVAAWLPQAAESAIEGLAAQGNAERPVLVCGDECGSVSSWRLAPLARLGLEASAPAPADPAAEPAVWTPLHRAPRAHGSLCSALVGLSPPVSGKGAAPAALAVTGGHDQLVRVHALVPGAAPMTPLSLQQTPEGAPRAGGSAPGAAPASRMANPPFCNALSADSSSGLVAAAAGDGAVWLLSTGPCAGSALSAAREAGHGLRPIPVLVSGGAADALRARATQPADGAAAEAASAADATLESEPEGSGAGGAAAPEAVSGAGTPTLAPVPGPDARLGWTQSRGRVESHLSPCVDVRLVELPGAPRPAPQKPASRPRKPGKRTSKPSASSSSTSGSSSLKVLRRVWACSLALDGEVSLWDASAAASWAEADAAAEVASASAAAKARGSGKKSKASQSGFRPASLSKPCEVPLLGRFRLDRAVNQAAFATTGEGALVMVVACPDASLGVVVVRGE